MPELLKDRVAIVTGAGRGIGRAVAEAYAAQGATVVVSDVDGDAAERVAAELNSGASAQVCDVSDEQQVIALVNDTVARHGGLHDVVAVAGIATSNPLVELSYEEWRGLQKISLDGVFFSVKYGAPAVAAAGGGSVITMASITALAGAAMIAHYASAKAAVVSLTQTAALEFRPAGVRVNAILPGFVDTDMYRSQIGDFEEALGIDFDAVLAQKQGRLCTGEEVANLAVFLASDRAKLCTGGKYVIDGGASASLL